MVVQVYMLFYMQLPTGACAFTVLSIPTICMSRADQRAKATKHLLDNVGTVVRHLEALTLEKKVPLACCTGAWHSSTHRTRCQLACALINAPWRVLCSQARALSRHVWLQRELVSQVMGCLG